MKKGDKLKVLGEIDLRGGRRPLVEYELDDGAKMHGVLVSERDVGDKAIPEDAARVTTKRVAKDTLEVVEVHKGPARVSSAAYRSGWDAIFGAPRTDRELN